MSNSPKSGFFIPRNSRQFYLFERIQDNNRSNLVGYLEIYIFINSHEKRSKK